MIIDIPFAFRVDVKAPGGRAWKRKECRDVIPVEVAETSRRSVSFVNLLPSDGFQDWLVHEGKLYEAVPEAGVHGTRSAPWTGGEWLLGKFSPILPHDPLHNATPIDKVPRAVDVPTREARHVDRDSAAAAAASRAADLLSVEGALYRHSAGPYHYLAMSSQKEAVMRTVSPLHPETDGPVRFGGLFSARDTALAAELASGMGIPVKDVSIDVERRLGGIALRSGEETLHRCGVVQTLRYIDDMLGRNVTPDLMLAIAEFKERGRPTPVDELALLERFVEEGAGIKDLRVADKVPQALTVERLRRFAEPMHRNELSHGTPLP